MTPQLTDSGHCLQLLTKIDQKPASVSRYVHGALTGKPTAAFSVGPKC